MHALSFQQIHTHTHTYLIKGYALTEGTRYHLYFKKIRKGHF